MRQLSRPLLAVAILGIARDLQKRHGQWFKGKTLDPFCPMGPVLVTADEIPDPQQVRIELRSTARPGSGATPRR